jgi:hypothetical protein
MQPRRWMGTSRRPPSGWPHVARIENERAALGNSAVDEFGKETGENRTDLCCSHVPLTNPASARRCSIHVKTASCVSRSIKRRVREIVEWSGGVSGNTNPDRHPEHAVFRKPYPHLSGNAED